MCTCVCFLAVMYFHFRAAYLVFTIVSLSPQRSMCLRQGENWCFALSRLLINDPSVKAEHKWVFSGACGWAIACEDKDPQNLFQLMTEENWSGDWHRELFYDKTTFPFLVTNTSWAKHRFYLLLLSIQKTLLVVHVNILIKPK